MAEVIITCCDIFYHALKMFKEPVEQMGILAEDRRRAHFEPSRAIRKMKAAAKRRKTMKNAQRGG